VGGERGERGGEGGGVKGVSWEAKSEGGVSEGRDTEKKKAAKAGRLVRKRTVWLYPRTWKGPRKHK